MIRNRLCEICERPATKEHSLRDDEGSDSFFCSDECKHYATWRGKIFVGAALIIFGLLILSTLAIISIIMFTGGAIAIKIGLDHSKIVITTGKFAPTSNDK